MMSTVPFLAEQRVILDHIRWQTYLAILDDAENCRGRITYDRGVLEIMAPSKLHEKVKSLIGRMVEVFTEELNIDIESVGSTTFKREDLAQGFEPDESYYIQHAAEVRGKDEIDLLIDPPPDLLVEVDISRSSLNKFDIYSALGVPEVWRYDGERLRFYVLQADTYIEIQESLALPPLSASQLSHVLSQRLDESETTLIRQFRQSIQDNNLTR
ncbi:Uma2 family endonuclease [Candidatus Entotheonella palauensis]|nr:Uma2 family endonuclease [Candidatus Entotheonella palauensis]